MAKKKEGEAKSGLSTLVKSNIEIGTNDLVAVRVARAERVMLRQREDLEKVVREVKKEIEDGAKALDKAITDLIDRTFPEIATASTALEALGFDAVSVSYDADKEKAKLVVRLSVGSRGGYGSSEVKKTLKTNDSIRELFTSLLAKEEQLREVSTELGTVRQKLGQLATAERQARALIVEQWLEEHGETELLESLRSETGDILDGKLALPSPDSK